MSLFPLAYRASSPHTRYLLILWVHFTLIIKNISLIPETGQLPKVTRDHPQFAEIAFLVHVRPTYHIGKVCSVTTGRRRSADSWRPVISGVPLTTFALDATIAWQVYTYLCGKFLQNIAVELKKLTRIDSSRLPHEYALFCTLDIALIHIQSKQSSDRSLHFWLLIYQCHGVPFQQGEAKRELGYQLAGSVAG